MEILTLVERQRRLAEIAEYAAGHFHTCGGRAELRARINEFWSRWIEVIEPQSRQQCGTSLLPPNVTVTKGSKMLNKKDLKRARRIARDTGCTIEAALCALAKVSVASYRGDDVLRKATGLSPQERQAVDFALTHKMDGKDRETDLAVFKALYGATTRRPPGQRIVQSTLDLLTGR
jgi:hypothetical protein